MSFLSGSETLIYLNKSMTELFHQRLIRDWENVYLTGPGVIEREFPFLWFLDLVESGMLNWTELTFSFKYFFLLNTYDFSINNWNQCGIIYSL